MSWFVEYSARMFGKFEGVLTNAYILSSGHSRILNFTCNGVESHYNANSVLVDLLKKRIPLWRSIMEKSIR